MLKSWDFSLPNAKNKENVNFCGLEEKTFVFRGILQIYVIILKSKKTFKFFFFGKLFLKMKNDIS